MIPSKFILFDTEFTAWEGSQNRNWSLCWEHKELISISALKVKRENNKLIIIDKFNYYIKPRINTELSSYIINLTGITQNKINTCGLDFEIVMEKFYNFANNLSLYSYGNDYLVIHENMDLYKIDIDSKYRMWGSKFLDIRTIFRSYNIDTSKYSSGTIYKHFSLEKKIKSNVHNSEWDTYSLFLTLEHLLSL